MNEIVNKAKLVFCTTCVFIFSANIVIADTVEINDGHLNDVNLEKLVIEKLPIYILFFLIKFIIIASIVYSISYYLFIIKNKERKKFSMVEKIVLMAAIIVLYFIINELNN